MRRYLWDYLMKKDDDADRALEKDDILEESKDSNSEINKLRREKKKKKN